MVSPPWKPWQGGQLGSSILSIAPVRPWPELVTRAWLTAVQSSSVPAITDFSGNEAHTVRYWGRARVTIDMSYPEYIQFAVHFFKNIYSL